MPGWLGRTAPGCMEVELVGMMKLVKRQVSTSITTTESGSSPSLLRNQTRVPMQPRCDVTARVPSAALVPGSEHTTATLSSSQHCPPCLLLLFSSRLPCSRSSPSLPFPVPRPHDPTLLAYTQHLSPFFLLSPSFVVKLQRKRRRVLLEAGARAAQPCPGSSAEAKNPPVQDLQEHRAPQDAEAHKARDTPDAGYTTLCWGLESQLLHRG
nr:uncharacterized protein LOC110356071 [Columba livia]